YPWLDVTLGGSAHFAVSDSAEVSVIFEVLAGGSTLFPGFGERLLAEMRKLVPKDARIKICAPPERKLSAWVGGSVVSSLSSFKRVWLTREEYKDGGLSALHRRTG
ncbi:Alpha-centractin, partial [Perkinsus olseni]